MYTHQRQGLPFARQRPAAPGSARQRPVPPASWQVTAIVALELATMVVEAPDTAMALVSF
jgi:hypothetical protein